VAPIQAVPQGDVFGGGNRGRSPVRDSRRSAGANGGLLGRNGRPKVRKKPVVKRAEIAQSVEHRSEKPGVASSILALGTFVYEGFGCFGGSGAVRYFPFYFPIATERWRQSSEQQKRPLRERPIVPPLFQKFAAAAVRWIT